MCLCPTWWPPSEYRWVPLLKMTRSESSVIPFLASSRKVWLTLTARVPCSNAVNIGERKTWTQSEFCTWQNPLKEKSPHLYSIPAEETAEHCAKFDWSPLSVVGAVTKTTREIRLNLLGCPKVASRSQPLVGQSSPYCEGMWRRYCRLTSLTRRASKPVAGVQSEKKWHTDEIRSAWFTSACSNFPPVSAALHS